MNNATTNQNITKKDYSSNETESKERLIISELNGSLNKLSVRPDRSLRRRSLTPNRLGISKRPKRIRGIITNI